MNTLPFYPKRELSPLRRACLSLGLPVDAKPKTDYARQLRKAKLGNTAIEYLKLSDDDQARRIVERYGSLNATERKAATIDYLAMAAGVDVHHLLGVIQKEFSRVHGMMAGIMVLQAAPSVIDVAAKRALEPDGHKDRELLFEYLLKAGVFENILKARTP